MTNVFHRIKIFIGLLLLPRCQTAAVVSRFPGGRTEVTGFESEADAIAAMRRDFLGGAEDTWVWSRD